MVVDSGCNKMMIKEKDVISDMKEYTDTVKIAKKGHFMSIQGLGSVELDNCTLNEVYFVPDLTRNLMSVNTVTKSNRTVYFDDKKVYILNTKLEIPKDKVIIEGNKTESGLYVVNMKKSGKNALIAEEKATGIDEWHRKLGHLSHSQLMKIPELCNGVFYKTDKFNAVDCSICARAKQVRLPFRKVRDRASRPLEIIHSDLCGAIDPPTYDNKNYFITLLDDYTHFCKVYLLETKSASEVFQCIKRFINEGETHFNLKASKIRCDNGGEFKNELLTTWCQEKGIILDFTIPHTPQLNGKSERLNLTLMNKARALIFDANCEKYLWGEAVQTAAYLTNRSPTRGMPQTPAENWYKKKPDLRNLQIFGQKVFSKIVKPLKKLDNQEPENQNQEIPPHQDNRREEEIDGNRRPIREKRLPAKYEDFILDFDTSEDEALLTYNEAVSCEDKQEWMKAIKDEVDSLMNNKTWTYVDENEARGKEILTSRWVFKVKDNGKFKARVVARGCSQDKKNIDYKHIFSPVVDTTSLRLLFAIAAKRNWEIQTLDVKTAFLNGELEEPIYMRVPEGFDQPGKICLLHKSLYGLRQAPCQWNKKFTTTLKELNMIQLKTDPCIFKSQAGDMFLAIHVDDGIIIGKEKEKIKKLLDKLRKFFEVTIDSEPKSYIGINIRKTAEGIMISQKNYAQLVLKRYGMENSKPTKTPIVADNKVDEYPEKEIKFNYREAVGSLLYLSCKTRPDLSFAVNYESRSMENPQKQDYVNIKRTLRYLKGTAHAA
ncbi:uncharacterized protein LOC124158260 [Ischnura elegans]|uniref:uncharacterized protein LOC124158260 n=1 Tax=Ischnura elegans TaxID=197161 RepID=UPI001ED86ECB|nr:uncharacterized protein LOC124158260 [Ischnura elegans]